jgi:hypothetical protein
LDEDAGCMHVVRVKLTGTDELLYFCNGCMSTAGGDRIEVARRIAIDQIPRIKKYPTPTSVGMFNASLSAPFGFVLARSFTPLSKGAAQGLLQRQFHRLGNAGDFAVSHAEELKLALDQLISDDSNLSQLSTANALLKEGWEPGIERCKSGVELVAVGRRIWKEMRRTVSCMPANGRRFW